MKLIFFFSQLRTLTFFVINKQLCCMTFSSLHVWTYISIVGILRL